jgi:uncharacterized protein
MPVTIGSAKPVAAPVFQTERIGLIDSLRGFAILGILLMNIPVFGMPGPSSGDPTLIKGYSAFDIQVWHFVEWFPEGTQRAIFSMLFGAGIILFTSRQENRLDGVQPADYFFRRQLWLLVFGLFDIYILLWAGDILFDYACYGMIMFVFRKMPPKALYIAAGICLLLMVARDNRDLYKDKKMIWKGERVEKIDTAKVKLTDEQKEQLGAMTEFRANNTHEKKMARTEKARRKMTGGYAQLYEYRTNQYLGLIKHYTYMCLWDVLLFMFLGMAFFKNGILTGKASSKVYWLMAIVGLGLGLTISYFRLQPALKYNFNWFEYTRHIKFESYTVSRVLRSIGIFSLLILLYKSGWFNWLFKLLRPVGQMAFTNYLTQSLICAIIFYGVGFKLSGSLQRHEIYYVVAAIWIVQIIWSNIWLRYFNFGPMEWCWRSLTYWKRQPFKRE